MSYLFWTVVYLIGVFGFQYTGILWFLLPAVIHIAMSMFVFAFGVSAALAPNIEIEEVVPNKDFGSRFLMQIATIVTAVQLFNIGYAFFAGMAVLQGSTLALSIFYQKLFDKEE